MYTDTHCHIFNKYYLEPENIINNLNKNNIKRIIINGYDLESNKEVMNLIKNNNVYGALGIHPDNITDNLNETIEYIKNNLNNDKIIAIGEIGLDYYHTKDNKEEQKELLRLFLNLAQEYNKPVIIHCRNAFNDLIEIIKDYKLKGIIHCYSSSVEIANELIKLGYKLGIGGVLTFKNSNLPDVLKNISIDNILLETDSPYLSPEPVRSTPNEPINVNFIAKKVSQIYNISYDDLAIKLEKNYKDLFEVDNHD